MHSFSPVAANPSQLHPQSLCGTLVRLLGGAVRCIHVHGASGLGKTRGVRLAAASLGTRWVFFLSLVGVSPDSGWGAGLPLVEYDPLGVTVGESGVAAAVAQAQARAPAVLLVDPADLLLPADPGPVRLRWFTLSLCVCVSFMRG